MLVAFAPPVASEYTGGIKGRLLKGILGLFSSRLAGNTELHGDLAMGNDSNLGERHRINDEELKWDGDMSVLDGVPYTGISYLTHPSGALKRESHYVDGFEHGLCREWHSNQTLKRAYSAERGVVVGMMVEWHESGAIKSMTTYECGSEMRKEEWDVGGLKARVTEMDRHSELMKFIVSKRREKSF